MTNEPKSIDLLRFENVTAGYGKRPIVTGVSFSIARGEFLGIVGPNGSGKTTLLRTLLGILHPKEGRIEFPSTHPDVPVMGYVPQRDTIDLLLPFTTAEVVMMGRYRRIGLGRRAQQKDMQAIDCALEQVGMESFSGKQFRDLSGGQKQRTLIARALASEPEILILDEPTNGMDIASRQTLLELIQSLHASGALTVVMVSHLLGDVANCAQRIALIDGGHFTVGASAEILNETNLSQIYGTPIAVTILNGKTIISAGGPNARH
ncbi:MAG: metal ABC transporter ATP-binding protein [Ignavibacteriales bacterium]|nr:metal ABC transporter ATP-binding protein [Ignavibacteriales bacterium]